MSRVYILIERNSKGSLISGVVSNIAVAEKFTTLCKPTFSGEYVLSAIEFELDDIDLLTRIAQETINAVTKTDKETP
jgi:hypothetical protein